MDTGLNLNSLSVDESGRVKFSGLSTGIDFAAAVDAIIAARRIPVDRLEANVTGNEVKIIALQEMRSLLNAVKDSLGKLYGAVSVGDTNDIFSAKSAFATVSRTDSVKPSDVANLIGVSVTNAAGLGSRNIEVLRVAKAQKVMSDAQSSDNTALNVVGTFAVNGQSITVAATDTLRDIRDRINNANNGTNATKVTAGIVSVSASEKYLVLTADETGTAMTLADTSGTPLATLGVLTGGGAIKTQLQAAETARLKADGLINPDRFESDLIGSDTTPLSTFAGTLTITGNVGTDTVAYTATTTLTQLKDAINTKTGTTGVTAAVVAEGTGFRLVLTNGATTAITVTDTSGLKDAMDLDNLLVIERNSNTISDIFSGLTLSLFQAEEGTNIKIDVDRDLANVKTEIQNFVIAYNDLRVFVNSNSLVNPDTGQASDDAGVLYGNRTLSTIEQKLGWVIGAGTAGVDSAFSVLEQIGIELVDNASVNDPLLDDTLIINDATLDKALLNNPDDVRKLFTFDFAASDPAITLLDFNGQTTFNTTGYKLNIDDYDLYQSKTFTDATGFTETDAITSGPRNDGISAITFDPTLATNTSFRYSYNATGGELMTVTNLTTGATETVDITAILDAIGNGGDLDAGETAVIDFATLDVALTLTGDGPAFVRGTDKISSGAQTFATTNITAGSSTVTYDNNGGVTNGGLTTLKGLGAYNAATGDLTVATASSGVGNLTLSGTAGLEFNVDGGGFLASPANNLDDGLAHTVVVRLTGSEELFTINIAADIASAGAGAGTMVVNVGEGMFSETKQVTSATSPMSDYLTSPAITSGDLQVRDELGALIGTASYLTSDSITDLKDKVNAIAGVTASIVTVGSTFKLEITRDNNGGLTFTDASGGNVAVSGVLDIKDTSTNVTSANIGGAATGASDGTATVSGNIITVTTASTAEGLRLLYNGGKDVSNIQIDFTVGVGAQLFFAIDDMLESTKGLLTNEIDSLEDQNKFAEERIDRMLDRLAFQREQLLERFIAMEIALATLERVSSSITELTKAFYRDN